MADYQNYDFVILLVNFSNNLDELHNTSLILLVSMFFLLIAHLNLSNFYTIFLLSSITIANVNVVSYLSPFAEVVGVVWPSTILSHLIVVLFSLILISFYLYLILSRIY